MNVFILDEKSPNNLAIHNPNLWAENVKTTANNLNRDYTLRLEARQSQVYEKLTSVTVNVDRYQREEKGAGTVVPCLPRWYEL